MLLIRGDMRLLESSFLYWKYDFREMRAQKRLKAKVADEFAMMKKYAIWRRQFLFAQRVNSLSEKALQIYATNTKRKCFGVFLEGLEKGRAASHLEEAIVRKNTMTVMQNTYREW